MSGETLGDLIATLGSIDDDEIDWPNVQRTTVLIHQTFHYAYPAAITALRQRLIVVPARLPRRPAARHLQDARLGLQRRHRAVVRHVRQRGARLQRRGRRARRRVLDLGRRRARGAGRGATSPTRWPRQPLPAAVAPDLPGRRRCARPPSRCAPRAPTGLELAQRDLPPRARALHLRLGHHDRRDDGRRGLGGRRRRVPGLRALHGRPLPAVRAARRATSRATCSARAGRTPGSRCSCRTPGRRVLRAGGLRPDARPPPGPALRHGRGRPRLRRRAADLGHVRGAASAAS